MGFFDDPHARTLLTILGIAGGLLTLLMGLFFWAFKWLLDRQHERTSERFNTVELALQLPLDVARKVERELLELKAELADRYVRREDWIRFGATIDAKLDTLCERFEQFKSKVGIG